MTFEIRPAIASEAQALSDLAFASKAHWGYAVESMESWRESLGVTPQEIDAKPTFVIEIDGRLAGFYSLACAEQSCELVHLWVAPRFMGQGAGRALVGHALRTAFGAGASSVSVDSDPNAEPFYLARGAVRRGEISAPIPGEPGRVRPQLTFEKGASTGG